MLKRFKFRAERDGKDVSVENGILSVEGVPDFQCFICRMVRLLAIDV